MATVVEPLPPQDAIRALERRGLKLDPSFSWQDVWQEEHAAMFTVAKSAGFDVLGDIHAALEAALKEGRTFRDFAKDLTPVLQAKGWWGRQLVTDPATGEAVPAQLGSPRRLQTIFDANMRVSYAEGHWASFERNKKARPFLRYVALLDDRTRPAHRARHNLVLPVDHPYWDRWAPPCGWNCRCTLQSLSQRDIDRLQREGEALTFDPPADTMRSFVNKRTGEISRIPDGIDPGWAHNAGKAGVTASANSAFAARPIASPPALARAAIEETIASERFGRFLDEPEGELPIALLPTEVGASTSSQAGVVLLSAETMRKQLQRHPDLTRSDYAVIPSLVENASLIIQAGADTLFLVRQGGRWRYAALKTTENGLAAYLTAYRFMDHAEVEQLLGREGVIILRDRRR
ncbi:phage minor head protein [Tianweitania sediminis]|uniref:Minor capsid protein n=1 Tax=Tianweitania sediminis TaxID=1502156 RepID=A0A8J7UHQ4_9HYPH|nr:phage minor head protein [Tianweitania sediminis]MBP0439444.1 minor capsid protein [Tianweitania sediminis]